MQKRVEPQPEHIGNIVRVVSEATQDDYTAGKVWYAVYRRRIAAEAAEAGLTAAQGVALFAVLSQSASLEMNWRNYVSICTRGDVEGVRHKCGDVYTKCRAILADRANPEQYATGPKISSFARNLAGDEDAVCVDRHAISACMNALLGSVGSKYDYVAACYRASAAMLGVTPAQCQAIVWLAWRRDKGIIDRGSIAV